MVSVQPRNASAVFSHCGAYRWWLERSWDRDRPKLLVVGLNPSRADGQRDDPTLRRIVGFARSWGFGAIELLNLFARISPSPAILRRCTDPVGRENDAWIARRLDALATSEQSRALVWLAWGNQGSWQQRDQRVLVQVAAAGLSTAVLGLTRSSQPRHPLYAPSSVCLVPFPLQGNEAMESFKACLP
jgi:hypothetical protein